ncbi:MAG: hypothetical protein IPK71_24740 [Myxococcales bacterium]|nr:hypothetical protein [Myxococcales bacterium]
MISFVRHHARRITFAAALATVALAAGFAASQKLSSDCCHPGAACCHPGAACCKAGHAKSAAAHAEPRGPQG